MICANKNSEVAGRHPGGLGTEQILNNRGDARLLVSSEHKAASLTRGIKSLQERPMATKWALSSVCALVDPCCSLLYNLWLSSPPSGARHTPTPGHAYSDACDSDASPHRHAGVIPLPQRIRTVSVIASSTLLGPVSMWIRHMYASANSLPCSRVPVFALATFPGPVCKWIQIVFASANSNPCPCRL